MENFRIHIICQKPEICSLIKKSLTGIGYEISCSEHENAFESQFINENIKIDCLILDSKLSNTNIDRLRKYNKEISFIYLPSLESEKNDNYAGAEKISEPLKISELSSAIKNILNQKRV